MRPKIQLLGLYVVEKILAEAFELIAKPGVKVDAPEAIELLRDAGVRVENGVAQIPRGLAETALKSAPREFWLYDRQGNATVHYGGEDVHFDPGSSCVNVLERDTLQHRPAVAADLVRLVEVAEVL